METTAKVGYIEIIGHARSMIFYRDLNIPGNDNFRGEWQPFMAVTNWPNIKLIVT